MRTNRCQQLRSSLTSYVDDEASAGDRLIVEDHLRRCDACRDRVNHERAVRQALLRWSVEARVEGPPVSWRAGSRTLTRRPAGSLLRVAALAGAAIAVVLVMWSRWPADAGVPFAARGLIGDSRCAGGHAHASAELRDMSGPDCVRRCVETGAEYVFVSDGSIYPIHNQTFMDLTRFAGQNVQLEGELRQDRLLIVSEVRLLPATRSMIDFHALSQRMIVRSLSQYHSLRRELDTSVKTHGRRVRQS